MLGGLLIYLWGQRYLPEQRPRERQAAVAPRGRMDRQTLMVLAGVALSVTVFRGAYEQVGNTVALWADVGVDRHAGSHVIPMTWFQSLNPLLVMLMTPPLLVYWRRRAEAGHAQASARRRAAGALFGAAAYLLLAAVAWVSPARAAWPWLVLFFAIFTFGELFILPTGLGLFARLAPPGFGATTVAAWFLTIFSGSLAAGLVGILWSRMPHAAFFLMLAAIAGAAALLLGLVAPATARTEAARQFDDEIG